MHFYERASLKGNVLTSNIEDAREGRAAPRLAIPRSAAAKTARSKWQERWRRQQRAR